MKKISFMIPCYNEEENVELLHEAIVKELKENLSNYDYEILFIDNKSKDNTREKLKKICQKDKRVKAIFNANNFGQFKSPYYGMLQTSGDCTISMCADFQDPVNMISKFVEEWEKGYKIVIGKKTRSKESKLMYFLRGLYYKMIKKYSTTDQIEQYTGFGLYDKEFINVLRNLHDPNPYLRGIVAELGFERKEIEYTQAERLHGKTSNNFKTLYDAGRIGITTYTKVGARLPLVFGVIFMVLGGLSLLTFLILLCFSINLFQYIIIDVLIMLLLFSGLNLFFIGFIGEYIMNMNVRILDRPLVVEEERINFK